jgi:hypothetical protein
MSDELSAGAEASERHIQDMIALDRAYFASFRPMVTKNISDITVADIEAANKPFNDAVRAIFDREVGRYEPDDGETRSDDGGDAGGTEPGLEG